MLAGLQLKVGDLSCFTSASNFISFHGYHSLCEHTAVANVACLKLLIDRMKTTCNFGFYQLNFETNCPIIIISKSRSILGSGAVCEVPLLVHSQQGRMPSFPTLSQEMAAVIRSYMAQLAGYPVEFDRTAASQVKSIL